MADHARSNAMFSKLGTGAFVFALALMPALGAKAQEAIKIGIPTGLSGATSVVAPSVVQSAELAVDEIDAAGGILGKKVELEVADHVTEHEQHQDDPDENPGREIAERDHLQDEPVKREQQRANQRLLRLITPGHAHGMARLLQKSHLFVFIQGAAQRRFPVFDL